MVQLLALGIGLALLRLGYALICAWHEDATMDEKEQQQSAIDARKRVVDVYTATIDRLEPEIGMIDPGAFYASAAISLKRIADALDNDPTPEETGRAASILGERSGARGSSFGMILIDLLAQRGFKVVPKK